VKPQIEVQRHAGHPWDGRPGFDLMLISAENEAVLQKAVTAAERKFWLQWLVGTSEATGKPGGILYKPSDIRKAWFDSPTQPHPGCLSDLP
jgi:hypothetical protein